MAIQTTGLVVLDPTVVPMPAHADMAPRLDTLNGKAIGLLANGKRNADRLLDHVAALMAEHYQFKEVVARNKGNASRPCPEDLIQELVGLCDAVVTATGD